VPVGLLPRATRRVARSRQGSENRVFVYETGQLEGEGIVQRGKRYDWVAEMIVETIRYVDDEGYTNGRGPDAAENEAADK
jgi:hypothetical protein